MSTTLQYSAITGIGTGTLTLDVLYSSDVALSGAQIDFSGTASISGISSTYFPTASVNNNTIVLVNLQGGTAPATAGANTNVLFTLTFNETTENQSLFFTNVMIGDTTGTPITGITGADAIPYIPGTDSSWLWIGINGQRTYNMSAEAQNSDHGFMIYGASSSAGKVQDPSYPDGVLYTEGQWEYGPIAFSHWRVGTGEFPKINLAIAETYNIRIRSSFSAPGDNRNFGSIYSFVGTDSEADAKDRSLGSNNDLVLNYHSLGSAESGWVTVGTLTTDGLGGYNFEPDADVDGVPASTDADDNNMHITWPANEEFLWLGWSSNGYVKNMKLTTAADPGVSIFELFGTGWSAYTSLSTGINGNYDHVWYTKWNYDNGGEKDFYETGGDYPKVPLNTAETYKLYVNRTHADRVGTASNSGLSSSLYSFKGTWADLQAKHRTLRAENEEIAALGVWGQDPGLGTGYAEVLTIVTDGTGGYTITSVDVDQDGVQQSVDANDFDPDNTIDTSMDYLWLGFNGNGHTKNMKAVDSLGNQTFELFGNQDGYVRLYTPGDEVWYTKWHYAYQGTPDGINFNSKQGQYPAIPLDAADTYTVSIFRNHSTAINTRLFAFKGTIAQAEAKHRSDVSENTLAVITGNGSTDLGLGTGYVETLTVTTDGTGGYIISADIDQDGVLYGTDMNDLDAAVGAPTAPTNQYLLHTDISDSIGSYNGTNATDTQFLYDAAMESMVVNLGGTGPDTAYFQISSLLVDGFGTGTDGMQSDTGAYSLGFWIRPTSLPLPSGQHYIITDHAHGVGGESFQCWLDDQGDIYLQHKDQNGGHTTWSWDTNTPLNQWSHILFTWDDQNGTCYLNGNTLGSKVMTAPPWDSPNPLFVGYRNQGGGDNHYGFEGYMTNLNVWSGHTLTPSEVSAVYSSVQKQTNTGENNMSFSTANKVRYLFEESLASSDSGGTGDVTLTGAEAYIDVVDDRALGTKALTSPSGGWATLPSDMSHLNSTEGYTVSFWAKSDQYQSGQSTPYAMEGMFLSSGAASSPYNFSFHNAAGTFLDWGMGASNGEGRLQSWSAEITNKWKHFAIVVKKGDAAYGQANPSGDDALMRIYVDGALVASQSPKSGSTYLAFDPQTADLSGWNIGRGFQGDIDAFEVYDAPASSADIVSLYSAVLEARTDVQISNVQAGSSAGSLQFSVGSTQHPSATLPFAIAVIKDDGQLLYNGMDPWSFMSMGSSGAAFDPAGDANSYPPETATQYLYSNNKWGSGNGDAIDLENDSYSLYWTDDQSFINAGMSQSTLDSSFTAADGTLLGTFSWDGSSFSFSASGASPYAGLIAGDYPLEDIMDALHLDNDGSYLDKISLTQIKSRLASGDQYGYRPRHVETSLLAEEFIKDLKSMTILAAKNANHISVAEYDLMVLASPAGFGMSPTDLVPEVPMVMMLDSYRSQLSRLFDRDETIRWDSAPSAAIMVAKSSQSLTGGHTGGLLISTGDLKVTSKLVVAAALQIGGDLEIYPISWDAALAGGLVTQTQYDAEVPANGDGTHTHADLVHLKVDSDFSGAGDLEVQETTTFGDAQANKSPTELAADLVDMNSTLTVMTTSELHKDVHAHSTMQVLDTAGAYAASNAYATNVTGDVQIGLVAAPTNALHLDVNATLGDNLLDSKATFDEDLQVEGLFNVDGAAAFDGATFTTFDVLSTGGRATANSADADSGSTPAISIKAENSGAGGTVKFETVGEILLSSPGVAAKTLITGAVNITDELEVGGVAQLGNADAAKSDADLAADLVDINANLTVDALTQMDEKVDADSTLTVAGKVTVKDSSSTGSVLDGDLTVGADAAAAKSDMGAAVTAGADAISGLSKTKVASDIKVGDLGSEVAITISDAPGAASTYHDSRAIEDGVSLNATGLAVIRSNDVSNPDADDIDVHIWASDAAGSIYLKGHQGIEVIGDANAGSGADITFDDQVDIKGNLTIEVDQNSAGPAMKMVSGGTNKMTMTVNTSGAAPKVDTVINNTVTAGIPQGGQLSIDGSLTVTGALLTPSPQLNIQAQTEVKISDNIFELSYESEFLSFADAIAFQSTHNAFSIAQIEAAAVAASDSDATLYAELTDAEKAQSTGGTAVEVRRDSNAGLYVPRTAVNPDGLSFWLQSSGDSHASDSDFMDRVINQGSRSMVVSPNNANPTDINDDTVMSIVRDGAGYLDGQAGSTYLDGSLVQALPVTPLWWQALLRASRLSSSEYAKMQTTWNDAQLMLDPNWVAMSEAEIRANVLLLAGQSSTTPARNETALMGLQYTGPMFHALQEKFAVLDNSVFQLMFAEKDVDGSGKLSIQNSGAKSGARHIFGTAPSLVVGGNGGVDKSEFGSTLDMGTDSTKADLMVFKAHSGAPVAQNIQLDSQDDLVFTQPAGQLRPGHASGQGMLLGAQHSMGAETSDLLINGQAQVNLKLQVKSLASEDIGLGAAANAVTSWGPFEADEASIIKVDLMAGSQGSGLTRGFVFNDDAPVIPALRLASSIDAGSSREIYSGAEAELQLNNFAPGTGGEADALIGGSLAMAGTARDRLVAESSIWFGEQLHVDMLKSSQDELRLQDKFTDGSTQLIDGSAGSSYKDISQTNVDIYGYTFSPDSATMQALIRAGVDVLHELTMQEAHDAGLLPSSGAGSLADHLASAGALASDPSGKSFVNLMKSISAAMNASAGMSHEERISQYYAPNAPIAMSEAFHALPLGAGTEGDIATGAQADATKKRIEVYLNGQRIPDSEYDLILSATHSGKKIAFRRPIERRDILIIESKVANPG